MMNRRNGILSILALSVFGSVRAADLSENLYASGYIWVVIIVLLVILIGIFVFLFRMEKKLKDLERKP